MTTKLDHHDIQAIHEAQQAVNLAVSSVQGLASTNNPLLAEIGLDLISQLKVIDIKLTRLSTINFE